MTPKVVILSFLERDIVSLIMRSVLTSAIVAHSPLLTGAGRHMHLHLAPSPAPWHPCPAVGDARNLHSEMCGSEK